MFGKLFKFIKKLSYSSSTLFELQLFFALIIFCFFFFSVYTISAFTGISRQYLLKDLHLDFKFFAVEDCVS